jgi:citrate synthase
VDVAATDETATLRYPGGELDLDIVHATEGSDGIALGPLLAETGYTTFDQGFVNTASTKSAITYIDANWTGLNKMAAWADKLGNQPGV